MTRQQALTLLHSLEHPDLQLSLGQLEMVRDVRVEADTVHISLVLPYPGDRSREQVQGLVRQALQTAGAGKVECTWGTSIRGRDIGQGDPVPEASNVVVITSGKGGVGKSTVAVNVALALQTMGARVGLLDADMYGPSVPTMMGTAARPSSLDGASLEPVERFGLRMMSIGFLLEDPKEAVVWRGPMLHGALMQFLRDVRWGKLDYLFLDLPPGTGDIPLTLSQKLSLTGAVIVTTPQKVALQDVYKAVSMCQKVNIPVIGVIENQSSFVCDGCGKEHRIFGTGGGRRVAEMAGAPLMGQVPMDPACREAGDLGTPVVMGNPQSPSATAFRRVAEELALRIAANHALRGASVISIDRSGGVSRHLPVVK